MVTISFKPLAIIGLAYSCLQSAISAEDLCSITPYSYSLAKTTYPQFKSALETIAQYSITAWYTDRLSEEESTKMLSDITSKCSEDSRMTIAVYGLPQKDCSAGLSSAGTVQSTSDYNQFLSKLTTAIGTRKVLYIVEPDAIGLLADNGCGKAAGYLDHLKVAVAALSANSNAELFLDVGHWLLVDLVKALEVATIVKELSALGTIKGIAINTSNYRSTDECTTYCTTFQTAMGSTTMSCIVDTSRNLHGSLTTDWCNVKSAGIGKPPTSETGISNIAYYMWVKPPGESDGICTETTQSDDTLTGVAAGSFYKEGFELLWDQGYFVKEQGMPPISGGGFNDTTQSSSLSDENPDIQAPDTSVEQDSVAQESDSATPLTGTVMPADMDSFQLPKSPAAATPATPTAPTLAPPVTPTNTTAVPPFDVIGSKSKRTRTGCKTKTRLRKL